MITACSGAGAPSVLIDARLQQFGPHVDQGVKCDKADAEVGARLILAEAENLDADASQSMPNR